MRRLANRMVRHMGAGGTGRCQDFVPKQPSWTSACSVPSPPRNSPYIYVLWSSHPGKENDLKMGCPGSLTEAAMSCVTSLENRLITVNLVIRFYWDRPSRAVPRCLAGGSVLIQLTELASVHLPFPALPPGILGGTSS